MSEYLFNPKTGEFDELDTSEKPALDIIGDMMFGQMTEDDKQLLADLSELGIGDCKYKLYAFKGFAQERGWKSPTTTSEYLSWLIWSANRDAGYVKTNAPFGVLLEESYNAAASFQDIYTLVKSGVKPAPYERITKGAKS